MAFICVDWGSSNCRAYLVDGGKVVAKIEQSTGVKSISPDDFPAVFDALISPWRSQTKTVYLFGMVTSNAGWVETPYIECPAGLEALAAGAVRIERNGQFLYFLPGLCQHGALRHDVMRGEEIKLLGVKPTSTAQLVVLPGTHSKWATLENGCIASFSTIMTGEVFDLILNNSLAGRLAKGTAHDETVFADAVKKAFVDPRPILHLFSARSSTLLGGLAPEAVASYLSGILIGNEIREGLSSHVELRSPVMISAATTISSRYKQAFGVLEISVQDLGNDLAIDGICRAHELCSMAAI